MSMLRFSCIKNRVYAPTESGRWVKQLYDDGTETGVVQIIEPKRYTGPNAPLKRYVAAKLAGMNEEGPLVLMINGFQFNSDDSLDNQIGHVITYHPLLVFDLYRFLLLDS